MPATLAVSRYTRFSNTTDVGQLARFSVNSKSDGLIVQYVKHKTCFNGRKSTTRRFTEAWRVQDGVIAHSGCDFFLIPRSYNKTNGGTVSIAAHAWFVRGDPGKLLREMKMHDTEDKSPVSGILPSEQGKVPTEYRRKGGVRRNWCLSWSKHATARGFKPDEIVHWRS